MCIRTVTAFPLHSNYKALIYAAFKQGGVISERTLLIRFNCVQQHLLFPTWRTNVVFPSQTDVVSDINSTTPSGGRHLAEASMLIGVIACYR